MGTTREIAEWATSLRYEDVPDRVHDRTKAQILSVLGAIHAGRHSPAAEAARAMTQAHGGPGESTVFATGDRFGRLGAVFTNCCYSVAFDFDDYLFAGHTGHSAVCASLAYGELTGASGRDVLAAATVGNELGGRLGAAFLFGPHNGQMWAYIHLLGAVSAAGRMLGLDADGMANAVGVALAQPPYPLLPAFMGPDSKLLICAQPTVDGCRAAELAARGWTGSPVILEDHQGFLRRFNPDHLGWMLSGFGDAWVSDSLTYKLVPGCAYVDTAVDAFTEIMASFEAEHGRQPVPEDVDDIHVRCGLFTAGMEGFSQMYRSPERLDAVTVNFSVALTLGLMVQSGALGADRLAPDHLDANKEAIEGVAAKVRMEHDTEMDRRAARAAEAGGFSLRALLAGASPGGDLAGIADRLREASEGMDDAPAQGPKTLEGVSFEGYTMAFPAEVTMRTANGATYTAAQDVPLGAAGRPWEETALAVRRKFLENYSGDRAKAAEAVEAVERLEEIDDIREVTAAFAS